MAGGSFDPYAVSLMRLAAGSGPAAVSAALAGLDRTQLRRIAEAQSLTITRATPAGLAKAAVARWRDRLAAAG